MKRSSTKKRILSRKKRILFSLVLFFLATLVSLVVAEVAIRIFYPQSIMPRCVENAPWGIRKVLPNVNAKTKTSEYSYRYRSNSQGFEGPKNMKLILLRTSLESLFKEIP